MTILDFVSPFSSSRRHCPGACLHLHFGMKARGNENMKRENRRNGNVRSRCVVPPTEATTLFCFLSFFFLNSAQNGNHIIRLIFFRFWCCHSKRSSHSNGIVGASSVAFCYNSVWSTLKKTIHDTPRLCARLVSCLTKQSKKSHHRPFIGYNFSFIERCENWWKTISLCIRIAFNDKRSYKEKHVNCKWKNAPQNARQANAGFAISDQRITEAGDTMKHTHTHTHFLFFPIFSWLCEWIERQMRVFFFSYSSSSKWFMLSRRIARLNGCHLCIYIYSLYNVYYFCVSVHAESHPSRIYGMQ